MTHTIRTAVIGVGYLGKFHAEKYASLPQASLVAVVDTHALAREEIAKKHQTTALTHYQDLLGKVDAVSIVTPTPLHFPIAQFFLEHGVHVLIEKPITQTPAEAEILIQLAQQRGCLLQVGHIERFNPALAGLQPWLHQPRFIESHRLTPFKLRGTDVNVVLDLMIHDIDIIQSLIPAPIHHIDATGASILSGEIDVANARIEFTNGCVASVTASRVSTQTKRLMNIFQEESALSLDFQQASLSICKKGAFNPTSGISEILREEFVFEHKDALLAEINAFLLAIAHNTPPLVSGQEGKRALETAIYISSLVQKPIPALA
ncbi:MAG: Gfo/Idh/MocA family oxidoreductase [Gammaproteobacteria bacterium]|nr:Gfo/Idh/MocA family oxidoreductase [Gammaproteobacteria bacterium]